METTEAKKPVSLYVKLHPDDARKVLTLCDKYGMEPRDFIALGTMRYVDSLMQQREAPPGRVHCKLPSLKKRQRNG